MNHCRLILTALALLTLTSCSGLDFGDSSNSGQLGVVRYRFLYALETYIREVNITPTGAVNIKQNTTTDLATLQTADTQLTPEQMQQLAKLFHNWRHLKEQYPTNVRSPVIDILYEGYHVQAGGGKDTPPQFLNIMSVLDEIATHALAKASQPTTAPNNPAK